MSVNKTIKKSIFIIIMIFFILSGTQAIDTGELSILWDELKELLKIDNDDVILSLETFEKLLAFTGENIGITRIITKGNVVLSRDEFTKLIQNIQEHTRVTEDPGFDYLVSKAVYAGTVKENNISFKAVFSLTVTGQTSYSVIRLLNQEAALEDVTINGKQALVSVSDGFHNIIVQEPGNFTIEADFSIKYSLEKGPHKIDLKIIETPMTLFTLDIPAKNLDMEIPQAQAMTMSMDGNTTKAYAVIRTTDVINVRWREKIKAAEKLPPRMYCESFNLISVQENTLRIRTDLRLTILHNHINSIDLRIPGAVSILTVSGEGVGEWQEITTDKERLLKIPFTYGQKGNILVSVEYEQPAREEDTTFTGLQVLNTVRESGVIGVELNTGAEVKIISSPGLETMDLHKLPEEFYTMSGKPLIQAMKFNKHPFSLSLDIQKHEKIDMPVAVINQANIVTLFTADGKIVYRLVYKITNSFKQFIKLNIPEEVDIWSVFVDNEPVESSINNKSLLIPLKRSHTSNGILASFPVEIIYCMSVDDFTSMGGLEATLPSIDILISRLFWSVYLPNDFWYVNFQSTLEKEEMINPFNLFSGNKRVYDKTAMDSYLSVSGSNNWDVLNEKELNKVYTGNDYKSNFRNIVIDEQAMNSQIEAEIEFNRRLQNISQNNASHSVPGTTRSIVAIQIDIPTGGQVFRFAKTLIKSEDPLSINAAYTSELVKNLIFLGIALIIIVILFLLRKRIILLCKNIGKSIRLSGKMEKSILLFLRSWFFLIFISVLFLLTLVTGSSIILAVLLFILLAISLTLKILQLIKNTKK